MQNDYFDIVIIGAGTAGCMAAYNAAKNGLKRVALVDRKKKERIGDKICGDGIGTKHLHFLEQQGFPIQEQEIILNLIKTARIVSPNKENISNIPTQDKLAIIKRQKFGQLLLKEAIEQGVTLIDKTFFKKLKREDSYLKLYFKKNHSSLLNLKTPLVIDASGFNSKIRTSQGEFGKYSRIKDDEQYYCHRGICQVKEVDEYFTDSAVFEFSYEKTRGGYIWFFSRGNNQINMGAGVPKKWIDEINLKTLYEENIASRFNIKKSIDYGGGFVPTRHPMVSHVKDNIILAGDAGAIVNPLHGGGLSASLASGFMAGELAANKVTDETVLEEDLWDYNLKLHRRYGKRYSMLDLYRILLQNISDKELNIAFSEEYLPLGMIFYAREYVLLLNLSKQLSEVWRSQDNEKLKLMAEKIIEIEKLMKNYPEDTKSINSWGAKFHSVYQTFQEKISIKD